jgi:hypothetical protein
MGTINKGRVKRFVASFFGHEQASIKFITNPNSIRRRFVSLWGVHPESIYGWSAPRNSSSQNWRKTLVFINKRIPASPNRKRLNPELEWTATHEVAHVYAERSKKVSQPMHEHFAELIALEYLSEAHPQKLKQIISACQNKKTKNPLILSIPYDVIQIHKNFPPEIRKEIIQDIANRKITRIEKKFYQYLYNKQKQLKKPNQQYLTQLKSQIDWHSQEGTELPF